MATVTKGKTFANGELVTPAKIHQLVDAATVTAIATADISNNAITTTKIADSNVTTAKIADSAITSAKIADGTIVNADISTTAAIALSKLATGALPTGITVASANIVDGTIVNADINNSAAIALSKLATGALPTGITVASANIVDGTIVNADISASAAIADSKLAQISTAGKVLPAAVQGTAVITTDSRLTNARTPTTHTHGNITNAGAIGTGSGVPIITGSSGVLQAGSFGTAAGTYCQGNDSRLSDTRTPTNLSVTTAKIADSAITSAKIADGTIVNADISTAAAIADSKLATISTAGKVSNSATTATSANTANAIVARNASGNFSAGTITANLTGNVTGNVTGNASGNAATATTLANARTIALSTDATGSVSFNGSANVTIPVTIANNAVTNAKIASAAITAAKIADDAVTDAKIASVDHAKLINTPYKNNCLCATTDDLTANYNNGNNGVGATLTNSGTLGVLVIDGITVTENSRVLVKNQSPANRRGIYTCTNTGSSTTAWVLTRATDADQSPEVRGAVVTIDRGTVNGGKFFTTDFSSTGSVGSTNQFWRQVVTTGDSGIVSTAMLADGAVTLDKALFPRNFPLQVVQAVKSSTQEVSDSGNVWEDITGLSLTLTRNNPSSSGKVRIQAVIQNSTNNSSHGMFFRILRGSTAIGLGNAAGNRLQVTAQSYYPSTHSQTSTVIDFIDNTPGSSASVTYKIQGRTYSTVSGWINRSNSDSDVDDYIARTISTLTLTELAP
jgi:hypothetical protein